MGGRQKREHTGDAISVPSTRHWGRGSAESAMAVRTLVCPSTHASKTWVVLVGNTEEGPVPASPPHHKVADALRCPQVQEQTGPRRRCCCTGPANSSLPAQPMPACTGLSSCPRSRRQQLALPRPCVPDPVLSTSSGFSQRLLTTTHDLQRQRKYKDLTTGWRCSDITPPQGPQIRQKPPGLKSKDFHHFISRCQPFAPANTELLKQLESKFLKNEQFPRLVTH